MYTNFHFMEASETASKRRSINMQKLPKIDLEKKIRFCVVPSLLFYENSWISAQQSYIFSQVNDSQNSKQLNGAYRINFTYCAPICVLLNFFETH